jgi:hypothetical protein
MSATKKQLADIADLAEAFRRRGGLAYAMACNTAPIQATEILRAFEWCAEELEELAKGME